MDRLESFGNTERLYFLTFHGMQKPAKGLLIFL